MEHRPEGKTSAENVKILKYAKFTVYFKNFNIVNAFTTILNGYFFKNQLSNHLNLFENFGA